MPSSSSSDSGQVDAAVYLRKLGARGRVPVVFGSAEVSLETLLSRSLQVRLRHGYRVVTWQ